jgi:hypothetical protein
MGRQTVGDLVDGRSIGDGERRWRVVRGGRRWEDFGVDGEREGKFGGKLGEQK